MAKYLLLKHYRGDKPLDVEPMDRWTPEEVEAHIGFMRDFSAELERSGEWVDGQAVLASGELPRPERTL